MLSLGTRALQRFTACIATSAVFTAQADPPVQPPIEVKICSPEGLKALTQMGTSSEKLKAYCSGTSPMPSQTSKTQQSYDLVSGQNDLAELLDDANEGKAIGATVRLTIWGYSGDPLCSTGSKFGETTTLTCRAGQSEQDHGILIQLIARDKATRLELLKVRARRSDLTRTSLRLTGRVVGRDVIQNLVIEIDPLIPANGAH